MYGRHFRNNNDSDITLRCFYAREEERAVDNEIQRQPGGTREQMEGVYHRAITLAY